MAKTKPSKKKPARKTAARKEIISGTDPILSPRKRALVLKKLKKIFVPPTHPSSATGPALALDYDAPLQKPKAKKKATKKR
jgi:hypothetical protein